MAKLLHMNNNFDALRLFAACCVFFSHMFAVAGLPEPRPLFQQSMGSIGVMLFFSISGYLVTQSWYRDPDFVRFASRRLLRVWPGYAVVVVLATILLAPIFVEKGPGAWFFSRPFWSYLSNLVLLRPYYQAEVFQSHPFSVLNGSLWSIPLEVWCYVGMVMAFRGCGRWTEKLGIAALVLLLAAYLSGYGSHFAPVGGKAAASWFIAIMLGGFFLTGSVLAMWPSILRDWRVGLLWWMLGGAAMVSGEYLLVLLFLLPWLAIRIGLASWPVVRQIGAGGDYSYGVYLYAWPMQQLSFACLGIQAALWEHFLLAGSLTAACAVASWHCIEKRALRFKPVVSTARSIPNEQTGA